MARPRRIACFGCTQMSRYGVSGGHVKSLDPRRSDLQRRRPRTGAMVIVRSGRRAEFGSGAGWAPVPLRSRLHLHAGETRPYAVADQLTARGSLSLDIDYAE
jgi:hypothetical protein